MARHQLRWKRQYLTTAIWKKNAQQYLTAAILKANSQQYLLQYDIDNFDSLQLVLLPLAPKLLNFPFLYFVLCWYSVQVVPVFLTCIQQYSKYWQHIVITLNIAAANTGITSVMPVFLNTLLNIVASSAITSALSTI